MSVLPLPWHYVSSTYSITASFVQYYRFSIYEDYGCSIGLMDTWVAIVITSAGPRAPVTGPLGIYFGVYGCLGIHAFQKHRSHRNEFLSSREDRNRSNQYIKLMCFSAFDLQLTGVPITALYLYLGIAWTLAFPGLK